MVSFINWNTKALLESNTVNNLVKMKKLFFTKNNLVKTI